ncbi:MULTISPECIES: aminotransferase class V-fold PLP-dependent enzyme [unclassified Arthrobacter]|uniref:aminotransferase class V-fold PLP-dependent enzyme n=1 Tax=unclassified Arthrobacter TaxID=235627 RepID=UPI002E002916|nr:MULTISPECIES: aminotransferase class V-fold PLP-dependent enzyme [unclassified Arthrobacter]MEC5191529.1 selenocysteine lyase/cysteine desulfurase [Arthrobacter sp. MP_M4]MEC5203176.1 selenocysteine lyase/cysteine desulfurase [Arthrobacter sp. MP_M7]
MPTATIPVPRPAAPGRPARTGPAATRARLAVARRPLAAVTGAEIQAPLIQGGHVRYANLDYGASAPALSVVSAYLNEILPFYASVHRGAGYASQISTSVYENARNVVRDFVGGRPDDAVIFTRNTTDSLNLLAGCLPVVDGVSAGEVLYLDIEHHANLLPWQRVPHRSVIAAPTLAGTLELLGGELAYGGVNLLAVTGASNVTGEILPVRALAALAHEYGARIVVDAAQLAPHRRIDMAADGIDYLAFSGHKLYAPFGAGVLIGRTDWLDAGTPHLAGGGAVQDARIDTVSWTTGPARHEGGSPNVLGAAALARATQVIAGLDAEQWRGHEDAIRAFLVEGLAGIDGVTVHQIFSDSASFDAAAGSVSGTGTIGVVNFSLEGYDAGLVAAYLSAEHGIGLRDGRFCAHPLLRRLGLPSGSLRASFGLGSRLEDAQRLISGIEELRRNGLGWDYVVDTGRWVPSNDTRSYPHWAPNTPGTAGAAPCTLD